jgi:hypothetical protein
LLLPELSSSERVKSGAELDELAESKADTMRWSPNITRTAFKLHNDSSAILKAA